MNQEKKKKAQDAFYNNNMYLSPMVRDLNKKPVKHRLGLHLPNGTHTSSILPKMRLRRQTLNNTILKRKNRLYRDINPAQHRLNLIRNRQRQILSRPNKLRLHRNVPQNFQIQVPNNNITPRPIRFRQILNESHQNHIRLIQAAFTRQETLIPTKVIPVSTAITTHKRFTLFSSI